MTAAALTMSTPEATPERPRASLRARVLFGVKLVVTAVLVGWLVRSMLLRDGADALGARLGSLSWPWIAVAIAIHFAAVTAGTARWSVLLRARGLARPLGELFRAFLVGRFIGAFTPSTTGLDGYRALEVGRTTGKMAESAAVIAIEKLFGLVGMAVVCAALLPFGLLERLGPTAILVAVGMAGAAALGLLIVSSPARAHWLASRAPGPTRGFSKRIADALSGVELGASVIGRALVLGVVTHLCLSATFAATGLAIGVDVGALELLAVGNAITLAVLLPVSIGGVGVREGTAVLLLTAAGVTTTDAVLLALLGYLTGQAPALLGGLVLALRR
jgi:hypothetical protein